MKEAQPQEGSETACSAEFLLAVLRCRNGLTMADLCQSTGPAWKQGTEMLRAASKTMTPHLWLSGLSNSKLCDPCFLKTEGFTLKHFIYFYIQPRSFVIIHKPRNDFLVDVTLKFVRCIHVPLWPISDEVLQQRANRKSLFIQLEIPQTFYTISKNMKEVRQDVFELEGSENRTFLLLKTHHNPK